MTRVLANIKNPALISRFEKLAAETAISIDRTVHGDREVLERGTLVGKLANGKHRAYAEGTVAAGGAFSNASVNFTIDVEASPIAKHLRAGDAIESTSGTALGTIATYDPVSGVGTLQANAAANLAAGQKIRIASATLGLSGLKGKVLKDSVECSSSEDVVGVGYFEGFLVKDSTTITDAAISAASWVEVTPGEVRIK